MYNANYLLCECKPKTLHESVNSNICKNITIRQITKDTPHSTQIIISLDIFLTWIIFLHAHPQVLYDICVKFLLYQLIDLGEVARTRNRQTTDRVFPI